ncbi:thioredoxin domain-containing protein [Thiohalorhabdus sp.]|uniref:thioredoxin domain-containing protein n=1 Tax=Thiohalorhabdus sp. TaxID=3094134 RepID=UPI002FC3A43F
MRLRALVGLVVMAFLTGPAAAAPDGERSGGWRLADAVSPYLRMHADNPVEWRPWGEAAFKAARNRNKPLFISIGYFTCHWCHVMERESFRDPAIARLLNEHFIAVKVDREQRPAVDAAYLRFVEATAGHGGWPLNVFATPEGRPFFGGTYFPPEPDQGEPGFRDLAERIAREWAANERQLRQAARVTADELERGSAVPEGAPLPAGMADRGARALARQYDVFHGGFGTSQKFPRASDLLFLLGRPSDEQAGMALDTLDAMVAGALFDQLGGGFHRYATDPQWRVPHFEKMLYTQALLGRAYLAAFERTGQPRHARVARRTLAFALTDMRHPQGGFFAALAASSPLPEEPEQTREGAYYTWSWEAFTDALGEGELREMAADRYGVEPGGNTGGAGLGRRNVLYRAAEVAELAQAFGLAQAEARERLAEARRRLARHRRQRPLPETDRKLLAAWNGYMVTTLVRAARVLQEPYYRRAARRTAAFVWQHLVVDGEGGLRVRRSWTDGRPGPAGTATDYAALAEAALALHRATGKAVWRKRARGLLEALQTEFRDPQGGLYARAGGRLWLRPKPVDDNPEPSANSLAVRAMLALGRQGGGKRWLEAARTEAAWQAARVHGHPEAAGYLLARWPNLLPLAD